MLVELERTSAGSEKPDPIAFEEKRVWKSPHRENPQQVEGYFADIPDLEWAVRKWGGLLWNRLILWISNSASKYTMAIANDHNPLHRRHDPSRCPSYRSHLDER